MESNKQERKNLVNDNPMAKRASEGSPAKNLNKGYGSEVKSPMAMMKSKKPSTAFAMKMSETKSALPMNMPDSPMKKVSGPGDGDRGDSQQLSDKNARLMGKTNKATGNKYSYDDLMKKQKAEDAKVKKIERVGPNSRTPITDSRPAKFRVNSKSGEMEAY